MRTLFVSTETFTEMLTDLIISGVTFNNIHWRLLKINQNKLGISIYYSYLCFTQNNRTYGIRINLTRH